MYFNKKVETEIVNYINSTNDYERDKIFTLYIYKPFHTIVKSLIHRYKHKYYCLIEDNIENLIHEVISHMVIKMPKYKQDSGMAFSYFSVIAKHYLTEKWYKYNKFFDISPDAILVQNKPQYDLVIDNEYINEYFLNTFIIYLKNYKCEISNMQNRIDIIDALIMLLTDIQECKVKHFNTTKFVIEYINEKTNNQSSIIEIKRTLNNIRELYYDLKFDNHNMFTAQIT